MQKIISYILSGPGRGKRYLLILAVAMALIGAVSFFAEGNGLLKTQMFQSAVEQLPDISIENGQVIQPQNFYKKVSWTVQEKPAEAEEFQFVVNTQTDTLNTNHLMSGIYLTKDKLYVVSGSEVTVQSLENLGTVHWQQKDYRQFFERLLWVTTLFLWIVFAVLFFVVFYISSLFYAVCSYVLSWMMQTVRFSFSVRRRMSVVSLILAYLLFLPVSFINFYAGTGLFFTIVLILESLFLVRMSKTSLDKAE